MTSVVCIKNILGNNLLSRSHHGIVTVTTSNYYCRSISSCGIIKSNCMPKLLSQSRYHHHICNYNKSNYNHHRTIMMRLMKNRRSLANVTNRSHETPPMPPDVKRSAVRSAILVSFLSSLMAWAILREPDEDDKMDYKAMEDTFRKQNQQINSMQHHQQQATSVDSASSNIPPSHNK